MEPTLWKVDTVGGLWDAIMLHGGRINFVATQIDSATNEVHLAYTNSIEGTPLLVDRLGSKVVNIQKIKITLEGKPDRYEFVASGERYYLQIEIIGPKSFVAEIWHLNPLYKIPDTTN